MPGKFHSGLGSLDHVLFPEQVDVVAQGGAADFGHQVAEEEFAQARLFAETIGYEIAAIAVIESQAVGAFGVHLGIGFIDKGLGFAAQEFEVMGGDGIFEDEVALFFKQGFLRVAYTAHKDLPSIVVEP